MRARDFVISLIAQIRANVWPLLALYFLWNYHQPISEIISRVSIIITSGVAAQYTPAVIGAAVVLLGIWLKAYVDHIFEKRAIAAVAYAELTELMGQVELAANVLGIFRKAINEDKVRKLREGSEAKKEVKTGEPTPDPERLAAQVKAMLELYKEFGSKNLVQAGPMSLGRLGPPLAYAVRSQYARIESILIRMYAPFLAASGTQALLGFLESIEDIETTLRILKARWEQHVMPMLARATGVWMKLG